METTKLSARQFMNLKMTTLEKRIVKFYREDPSDLRFLKEVALLKIRQTLTDGQKKYFPLGAMVRSILRRLLKRQCLTKIVQRLWQLLKHYFKRAEIFLLEKKFLKSGRGLWQRLTGFLRRHFLKNTSEVDPKNSEILMQPQNSAPSSLFENSSSISQQANPMTLPQPPPAEELPKFRCLINGVNKKLVS
ncbi:hypothetical protein [Enterococcus timonensis]|uniref:hypothetical protein n=1 Tax=Enterococcus timonensis TaxID=1852364 RepID=UPI0008DAFD78|nr:hypothetical protein [Enterococcus timonensis]